MAKLPVTPHVARNCAGTRGIGMPPAPVAAMEIKRDATIEITYSIKQSISKT
jgi:hypothetical protein